MFYCIHIIIWYTCLILVFKLDTSIRAKTADCKLSKEKICSSRQKLLSHFVQHVMYQIAFGIEIINYKMIYIYQELPSFFYGCRDISTLYTETNMKTNSIYNSE
jgi:hypothetical protein